MYQLLQMLYLLKNLIPRCNIQQVKQSLTLDEVGTTVRMACTGQESLVHLASWLLYKIWSFPGKINFKFICLPRFSPKTLQIIAGLRYVFEPKWAGKIQKDGLCLSTVLEWHTNKQNHTLVSSAWVKLKCSFHLQYKLFKNTQIRQLFGIKNIGGKELKVQWQEFHWFLKLSHFYRVWPAHVNITLLSDIILGKKSGNGLPQKLTIMCNHHWTMNSVMTNS